MVAENVAQLTAELEALEVLSREGERDDSEMRDDIVLVTPRQPHNLRRVALSSTPPPPQPQRPKVQSQPIITVGERERYHTLINEILADNDVLKSEYLELVQSVRGLASPGKSNGSTATTQLLQRVEENEMAMVRASTMKAESLVIELLQDKAILEDALLKYHRRIISTSLN